MKAMIFAAGIGSRLRPFTDNHPKALVPVGGVPVLERVLRRIGELPIDSVVVNVHHFASQITEFLASNDNFGLPVEVSDESDLLLDTGGGLLHARTLLENGDDSPILLHNADILTDVDLSAMKDAHLQSGADVTLLMSQRSSSRMMYFDNDGRLCGWRNLKTGDSIPADFDSEASVPLAFSGVHIVNPSVFPLLKQYAETVGKPVFSITPFYLAMMDRLCIKAYMPDRPYMWHDVGSSEKLAAAEAALAARR